MKTVELMPGVRAPLVTVGEMMELTEAAWQEERKNLLADLDAAGASPDSRLGVLRDHSQRRGTALVLLIATMRLEYASDIVRQAAFKAKVNPDEVLASMTPARMVEVAQMLCGYERADEGNAASPPATA